MNIFKLKTKSNQSMKQDKKYDLSLSKYYERKRKSLLEESKNITLVLLTDSPSLVTQQKLSFKKLFLCLAHWSKGLNKNWNLDCSAKPSSQVRTIRFCKWDDRNQEEEGNCKCKGIATATDFSVP